MKNVLVLAFTLWTVLSPSVHAQPPTLKDHMVAMSMLLDEIWVLTANPARYSDAADKVSELRSHLLESIKLTPPKLAAVEGDKKRLSLVEYQQHMARVIYLSASLETTLIQPDYQPISQSREQDVENLLKEISVTVGHAHGKYR